MPTYEFEQEIEPGRREKVTVEAPSAQEAVAQARAEHGGYAVGEVKEKQEGAEDEAEGAEDAGVEDVSDQIGDDDSDDSAGGTGSDDESAHAGPV